jgi:hypothetical protein
VVGCAGRAHSRTIVSSPPEQCQREPGPSPPFRRRIGWRKGRAPFPRRHIEKSTNLWILWKTQDSSVLDLWITFGRRLLPGGLSARIGDAWRRGLRARRTFKTPAQSLERDTFDPEALASPRWLSTAFRGARGHRRPLSTERLCGTVPESVEGERYTHTLAFRLRSDTTGRTVCPHVWKGLWTTRKSRRSKAFNGFRPAMTPSNGYAREQV